MLVAFILIKVEKGGSRGVISKLLEIEGVSEVHLTTGEWDIIAKVEVEKFEDFYSVIENNIQPLAGIERTCTLMALKSHKK